MVTDLNNEADRRDATDIPRRPAFRLVTAPLAAWLVLGFACHQLRAATLYVDNVNGSDAFNGRSARPISDEVGPTRTIRRALELAGPGATISILNRGRPYHESIALVGRRLSGHGPSRFIIEGNGATLDGSRPVPPAAWRARENGLWEVRLWRKGHVLLVRDGNIVPRTQCPHGIPRPLLELPAGRFCVHHGRVLYRPEPLELPFEQSFRFAALDVAITLYAVEHVEIRNLNIQHFRLDGITAHDRCHNVRLIGVASEGNGRAGLTVGGTSRVSAIGCRFRNNQQHSVRIEEFAVVELQNCDLDVAPSVIE